MEKKIIDQMVREHAKQLGDKVLEAFLEHFGFPLTEVEDKENLEHIVVQGSEIESYRYRGETFLYVKRPEVSYHKTINCHEVTFTQEFEKV